MAKASHPRAELWLALFAFMEASFFPIPPHPLLGLMCLAEPKKAIRFAVITTLASVAGGLLGYAIGHFAYQAIGESLLNALGLAKSFPLAACKLREYGVEIILVKGMTPIPFKLLTITAGFIAMPLVPFLLASLASRSISFLIVGILFRIFGAPIKSWIDRYLGLATAGFAALVLAGFVAAVTLGGHKSQTDSCTAQSSPLGEGNHPKDGGGAASQTPAPSSHNPAPSSHNPNPSSHNPNPSSQT